MFSPEADSDSWPTEKPLRPTRPPSRILPPAIWPVMSSSRMPSSPNATRPLIAWSDCGSDMWRMRPSVISADPENCGLLERPVDLGPERRPPRAADVLEEERQDAEVAVAGHPDPDPLLLERDAARHLQSRVPPGQLQLLRGQDVVVEREADRAVVLDLVVEQADVELVHRDARRQAVPVRELPDHPHAAAGHGARVGRDARFEQPDVRIEQRPVEAEAEFGIDVLRHLDLPGSRQAEARRLELPERQQPVTSRRTGSRPPRSLPRRGRRPRRPSGPRSAGSRTWKRRWPRSASARSTRTCRT